MVRDNTVPIMDISFINTTKESFLQDHIFPSLHVEEKKFVVTANPEIVMMAREDESYKQAIQKADYVVPDGVGVIYASKLKRTPLKERIPGYEVTLELLQHANNNGLSCYFYGASEFVSHKLVEVIRKNYPDLIVAGRKNGYAHDENNEIAKEIKSLNPDIVFVALGVPRQEHWIANEIDEFDKGLFIGVGGTFDGIAGEVKRAPEFWINLNLEWFYRLIKQPLRWKRVLKVFQFMGLVLFKKG